MPRRATATSFKLGHQSWNKGKALSEEHLAKTRRWGWRPSPETLTKLRARRLSVETRAKISQGLIGKPGPNAGRKFSAESRARMSASRLGKRRGPYKWTVEGKQRQREAAAHRGVKRPTTIEIAVKQVLDALSVDYVFQYPVAGYIADFYIPSRNLILECDGAYWHSLPRMKARDDRHDAELATLGYKVARMGEQTIKQDANRAVQGALACL